MSYLRLLGNFVSFFVFSFFPVLFEVPKIPTNILCNKNSCFHFQRTLESKFSFSSCVALKVSNLSDPQLHHLLYGVITSTCLTE